MIYTQNDSVYQIKHLVNNPVNTNKFVYIDSIDGNITIKDNKWFFDLNYYVIDNSQLPLNIFLTNLQSPFAEIKDIGLQYSEFVKIPEWVVQKDECKVYKSVFSIDIGDSKFFQQQLTEYLIYLEFSFDINTDVINNTQIDVNQQDLDTFISEWNLIHQTLSFDFSNFINLVDDCGSFENGNQFYLNSKYGYETSTSDITYKMNKNLDNKISPITNLLSLKTTQPFWINKISKKFYYSFNDIIGIKTYESIDNNRYYVYDEQDVVFKDKTTFDEDKNEIVSSLTGIDGFYIPKKASGYIEVVISISQNENTKTYCFKQDFNFLGKEYDNQIQLKEIFINDLSNFERIEF